MKHRLDLAALDAMPDDTVFHRMVHIKPRKGETQEQADVRVRSEAMARGETAPYVMEGTDAEVAAQAPPGHVFLFENDARRLPLIGQRRPSWWPWD